MLLDFKILEKATVIKMPWYWHRTETWTSGTLEVKPRFYSHSIFDRGAEDYVENRVVCSVNRTEETASPPAEE